MFGPERVAAEAAELLAELAEPARAIARAGRWLVAASQQREIRRRLPPGFWRMSAEELRTHMPVALADDLAELTRDPRFVKRYACARPVIVLDTFEAAPREDPGLAAGSAAVREAVRRMCRAAEGPLVLIGARDRLDWHDNPLIELYELSDLSAEDCARYLGSRFRDFEASDLAATPPDLPRAIHQVTGGHPLYLGICADICWQALRQGRTPAASDFDPARATATEEGKLRYLVDRLLREVPPEHRRLVDLAAFPLCFDRDLLRAMLPPESRADLRGSFGWLTRLSFVTPDRDAPGLYRVEAAVRAIRTRWEAEDNPDGFREAHRLVRDHLRDRLATFLAASATPDQPTDLAELRHLLSAWAYSAIIADPDAAEPEVLAVAEQALSHWRLPEGEAILAGWKEAAELPGRKPTWRLSLLQGRLAHKQGHFHDAEPLLRLALDQARAAADQQGIADCAYYLAWLLYDLGRWQDSLNLYQEALAIHEQSADQGGIASALHSMAVLHASQGDLDQALALYDRSLAAQRALGNLRAQAATLHSMAILHRLRGEWAVAMQLCEEALLLARECGDRRSEAAALHEMAALLTFAADNARALDLYEQSLAIARDLHDLQAEAATLRDMGIVRANQGDYDRAAALSEESLALTRKLGDRRGEVHCLTALAVACARRGHADQAWELWQQGLDIARDIADGLAEARILHHMARACADRHDLPCAMELYEQCLPLQRAIGDRLGEADTLHHLAVAQFEAGDAAAARANWEASVDISRELDDRLGIALTMTRLAVLSADAGDAGAALACLREAVEKAPLITSRAAVELLADAMNKVAQAGPAAGVLALAEQARATLSGDSLAFFDAALRLPPA
jgi:tetratricopeptide (TPR) repeat protein